MNTKKVLLVIMLAICVASIVGSVVTYNLMPRSTEEYQICVMDSSSMIPTIMEDSFFGVDKTVDPNEINAAMAPEGDIIAFYRPKGWRDPNDLIVHRAISKAFKYGEWYFKTKGDANFGPDPWEVPEDYLIGKVVDLNLQPTPPMWSLLSFGAIATAIVTGILSLVLFTLIKTEKHGTEPKTARQPPPSPLQTPIVLAICPQCKSRVPSESKFCPECGTNLQPKKTP